MPLQLREPPKSLCLLRLSAIGDVTHVVPVIRNLQLHWPETAITWIIGKLEYSLLKDLPGVEFIVFKKEEGLAGYYAVWKELRRRKFDILLHMQASLRASFVSLLVRAPVRIGFDRARAINGQWLFTNYRIASIRRQHVLDSFLEFAKVLGISSPIIRWDILISGEDLAKTRQWVPGNTPFLVINPSSSMRVRNWRNWDPQAYARVIDYAANRYALLTVLTGGPAVQEVQLAETIEKMSKNKVVNVVGKTNLRELLALLSRAVVVISPDTGPAHMANAAGTPVVGLYASSNPYRTGPYNSLAFTVNRYPVAVRKICHKSAEEVPWGTRVRDPLVMALISVEDVISKIDKVLVSRPQKSDVAEINSSGDLVADEAKDQCISKNENMPQEAQE